MKSYIKIVKAMFSGNKRVLAEAFSVMVILLALEMTIPVCVNKMINGLAVENGIVTFWEESFYLPVHMESFVFYQHLIQNYIFVLAINYYGTCGNKFIKCYGTAATWKMCRKRKISLNLYFQIRHIQHLQLLSFIPLEALQIY